MTRRALAHAALRLWLVVSFAVLSAVTPVRAGGVPFTDIEDSFARSDIEWLWDEEITRGCNEVQTLFCPGEVVTREQMASFLARAFELPHPVRDVFTDDNGSIHEIDINRLADAEITLGCGESSFCPLQLVTREQMASLIVRALKWYWLRLGVQYVPDDLPGWNPAPFDDVAPAGTHGADVAALALIGVTRGCAQLLFCPQASGTREQVAAFLHRADISLTALPRTRLAAQLMVGEMLGVDHDLSVAEQQIEGDDFEVDISPFQFVIDLQSRDVTETSDLEYTAASGYDIELFTEIQVDGTFHSDPFNCSITFGSPADVKSRVDFAFIQPVGEPATATRFELASPGEFDFTGVPIQGCEASDLAPTIVGAIVAGIEAAIIDAYSVTPELCRGDDTILAIPCPP